MLRRIVSRRFTAGIVLLSTMALTGCGGSDGEKSKKSESGKSGSASKDDSDSGDQLASSGITMKDGRQWYGDVPLNVFLDDPNREASDTRTSGTQGAPVAQPTDPVEPVPTEPEVASSGSSDWGTLIPVTVLDNEVKNAANRIKGKVISVGAFNSGFLELPPYIGSMAAMAHIATMHPEEVRWKENAAAIRTLSAEMVSEPLKRGAASQRKLQGAFESIEEILQGSTPAELPEIDESAGFLDVADFGDLMKRLEAAQNWLTVNVGSEEALKEKKEEAAHEAHVLAALAQVIADEGYGYSDDEEFLGHSEPMRDAALKIAEATESGDFAEVEAGLSRIMKSCTECHSYLRN